MRLRSAEDDRSPVAKKWRGHGMESGLCLRHAGVGGGSGVVLALSSPTKRKCGKLGGIRKVFFFKVRRFQDEEDLRQQLQDWHREVNQERPCRATGVIPAARWAEEKSRLRPLKVQPEELALRIPVYVGS